MGQAKAAKEDDESDRNCGFDIDDDDFPNVTGDMLCPGSLKREIPPPMLAYVGFAVRLPYELHNRY